VKSELAKLEFVYRKIKSAVKLNFRRTYLIWFEISRDDIISDISPVLLRMADGLKYDIKTKNIVPHDLIFPICYEGAR
jgi:hypothetical protein